MKKIPFVPLKWLECNYTFTSSTSVVIYKYATFKLVYYTLQSANKQMCNKLLLQKALLLPTPF